MPSPAPIHSVVPAAQPVIWAASRVEVESVSDREIMLTRLRLNAPEAIWSLIIKTGDSLDAAASDLVVGRCQLLVVADWYLLLKTEAMERQGKRPLRHRLHHISGDGRVLWSLPWQTTDQVGLLGDRFVIVRYLCSADDQISQPPLVAHLVDPRTGRSLLSCAVPIPGDLLAAYQQGRGAALRVALEHDGQRFQVSASLAGSYLSGRATFTYALPFGQAVPGRVGFVCPDCLTPGTLQITAAIQLPADSRSDSIGLQIVACVRCGFAGVAVYEESRREASDEGSWAHAGFHASAAALQALEETIRRCPRPADAGCLCPAHLALGRRDENGRWQRPDGLQRQGIFPMRLIGL